MNDTVAQIIISGIIALIGGSAGAAVINALSKRWEKKYDRKIAEEDKAEAKTDKTAALEQHAEETDAQLEEQGKKLDAVIEGMRVVLLDRIRYLGQSYINKGEIDFDDRRIFHMMHDVYHDGLGGNGDADLVVEAVDALPRAGTHHRPK